VSRPCGSGDTFATAFVGATWAFSFRIPVAFLQLRFRTSSQTDTVRRIQERRASLAMVCDNRAGRGMRLATINARRGAGTGSAKALPRLFGRLSPVC